MNWLILLPLELEQQIEVNLLAFERGDTMPYITGFERRATERGLQEGLQQGLQQGKREEGTLILMKLLKKKIGEIENNLQEQIKGLSVERLEELTDNILDFTSKQDLISWLESKNSN